VVELTACVTTLVAGATTLPALCVAVLVAGATTSPAACGRSLLEGVATLATLCPVNATACIGRVVALLSAPAIGMSAPA
jgi:hypothetical protein